MPEGMSRPPDPQHMADGVARREPSNRLNELGVLTRREIEARIVAPLIDALGAAFGRDQVVAIVRDTITAIARTQGDALADAMGGRTLPDFASSVPLWQQDGALEIDVLEQDDERFDFNVTRCRYAELYAALGIADLGTALSCNRDFALIEGFNPAVVLTRTQTIMQGASHCDFRYRNTEAECGDRRGSGEYRRVPHGRCR